MLVSIDSSNIEKFVRTAGVSLLFWRKAPSGPSLLVARGLELLAELYPDVRIGVCDMREHPGLSRSWQVTEPPTLMLYRDGLLLFTRQGMVPLLALEALVKAASIVDMDEVRKGSDGQGGRLELVSGGRDDDDDVDLDDDDSDDQEGPAPASPPGGLN